MVEAFKSFCSGHVATGGVLVDERRANFEFKSGAIGQCPVGSVRYAHPISYAFRTPPSPVEDRWRVCTRLSTV